MKTLELSGNELNARVAMAEGWYRATPIINGRQVDECWWHPSFGNPAAPELGANALFTPRYDSDWSQGGPIIERERIAVVHLGKAWTAVGQGLWVGYEEAYIDIYDVDGVRGETPLIVAMRCYLTMIERRVSA